MTVCVCVWCSLERISNQKCWTISTSWDLGWRATPDRLNIRQASQKAILAESALQWCICKSDLITWSPSSCCRQTGSPSALFRYWYSLTQRLPSGCHPAAIFNRKECHFIFLLWPGISIWCWHDVKLPANSSSWPQDRLIDWLVLCASHVTWQRFLSISSGECINRINSIWNNIF